MGSGKGATKRVAAARSMLRPSSPELLPARIEVQEATLADIPALASVKREVARATYEPLHASPELEEWLQHHCGEDHYRYRVGRSGYHVLVARDAQGEIVGVATMRKRGSRADMSGLYVTRRGEGIGSELSRRREAFARGLGCDRVRVSVWRSNERAKVFVQKQGFKRSGGGYRESTVGVRVDHYERDLLPA